MTLHRLRGSFAFRFPVKDLSPGHKPTKHRPPFFPLTRVSVHHPCFVPENSPIIPRGSRSSPLSMRLAIIPTDARPIANRPINFAISARYAVSFLRTPAYLTSVHSKIIASSRGLHPTQPRARDRVSHPTKNRQKSPLNPPAATRYRYTANKFHPISAKF